MKKIISFVLSLLMVLSIFALPTTVLAEDEAIVDVSFRDMDETGDLAASGADFSVIGEKYTQGISSMCLTAKAEAATGNFIAYIYRKGQKNNPADITGATMVQFDMWVPTDGLFDNIASDARVNVVDAEHLGNGWGSSGGEAAAKSVKDAMKGLKAGWNHVSIPLNQMSTCTNAAAIRFYMLSTGIAEGTKVYIDDVRFVNDAANKAVVPCRNAAKDVIGLLVEGNVTDGEAAYKALTHAEREYIPDSVITAAGLEIIPKPEKYTLSFDVNGGNETISDQSVYEGDVALPVTAPTKEGFVFDGWYHEDTPVDLATFTMPSADTTLTASWAKGYNLIFDWAGADEGPKNQLLKAGDMAGPIITPVKAGNGFEGWYEGDTLINFDTFVMPERDVTVTAKWGAEYFILSFDTKGGVGTYENQKLEIGQKPKAVANPKREGYTFMGWYNGLTKFTWDTFVMPAKDVTLSAKWKAGEWEGEPEPDLNDDPQTPVTTPTDVITPTDVVTPTDLGDVNGDDAIDAKDALEILKAAVDKITLTDEQKALADVNGDKAVDAKDALLVLRYAVKKIDKFPIQ